ncbi:MAG: tyrosine-protein phosphatase [Burkholderiaceae bacterium]|nr:tyrosine-protein phosphatase [Rhodoferax sp.]
MQTPPTRHLALQGSTNFRDLGGYAGRDGRSVRWRRLFRSDHLGALSASDIATVSALGLARVCDLRGAQERTAYPCVLPGVTVIALPIEPTVVQGLQSMLAAGQALTVQATTALMEQTYRDFVHDNSARFAELFDHLLHDDTPLVFHCTAGKDRTGFAAALILSALGVPRPVIEQDYLLTNTHYRQPHLPSSMASQEVLDVLWTVQPGFLAAALQVVDADYGGIEAYLEKAIGLAAPARTRLEQMYLVR